MPLEYGIFGISLSIIGRRPPPHIKRIVMKLTEQIEKLSLLADEVKDIHPLLSVLFRRLPNIVNVEYSHGQNEMGADFVLTKNDATLSDYEYIGVIVKKGKIKQDHSEVDRQIEECEIERKVSSGKKKIFISEIWIASNDSISNGAEEKIHHKYKNKNIKFLSGEKICELIGKFYPEYWSDVSVEIGEYLRSVAAKSEVLATGSSRLFLEGNNVYVKQDLVKVDAGKKPTDFRKKSEKKYHIGEILKTDKFVFIEAMMGTGKSTLLANLATEYSSGEKFNEGAIVPIILSAKDLYENHFGNCIEVVQSVKRQISCELRENGVLFLVDALDELKVDLEKRIEFIKKIFESASAVENIQIVITSRTIDDFDLEKEIDKTFSRYSLCHLTTGQVINLVDALCRNESIKKKLLRDLEKSHLFKVLPKTPISAILLARLLKEDVQEIPSSMTELYSKYMELVMGRWDMDKGMQSQAEYDVINNVSINIAKYMLDNSISSLSASESRGFLDDYLSSRNLCVDADNIFLKIIKKEEIFYFNKEQTIMSFRHRTFSEYLYACGMDRDRSAHLSEQIYDLYWSNSFFFYFGLQRDCPDLIAAIRSIPITSESNRISKLIVNGNFLLAAYLTPYDEITKSVKEAYCEVAKYYDDLIEKSIDSPLQDLSPASILFLFASLLKNSYGYEYFKPALDHIGLDLCSDPDLSDAKLIELFLVNSTIASLDNRGAFDSMINDYGKKIPLVVKMGILGELNDSKAASAVLKRFDKDFRKKVKDNPNLRESLKSLIEKPTVKRVQKKLPNDNPNR